jgi:hypothetical protein
MFRMILKTQWKWARIAVLAGVVGAFAVPMFSFASARDAVSPRAFIDAMQGWGAAYGFLAGVLGLLVAMSAWSSDYRGRHVYALSLPIERWRYVLLRFGAGVVCLIPPVIALGVSAVLVTSTHALPDGMHGYPVALTIRFALAALVAFALFFAASSATSRAAAAVLGLIAVLVVAEILTDSAGLDVGILDHVGRFVFVSPGLLSVFTGRWMLIDV